MFAYQLIQTLYWLALSTWFGGVVFVAVAAPIIFRTIREANPILPTVLSVNLENQHASLLAGATVANILRRLSTIQLGCAAVLLLMLIAQWLVMDRGPAHVVHGIIRSVLFVAAVVLVVYDRYVTWPKVWKYREEYIANADEPEVANPAKEQFDRYHRESMWLLFVVMVLLSLMIVFSSNVTWGGL
ncbi:MAG: hypothetical protein ACM359_21800 [Bacillota bacterium]